MAICLRRVACGKTLKANGHARQAYHNAGQAVEFALKAIYIRRNGLAALPPDCVGAKWHDLALIAARAGLEPGRA